MNRSASRPAEYRRAVLDQAAGELPRQEPCLALTAIDELMPPLLRPNRVAR
jgi:hypothetical protein